MEGEESLDLAGDRTGRGSLDPGAVSSRRGRGTHHACAVDTGWVDRREASLRARIAPTAATDRRSLERRWSPPVRRYINGSPKVRVMSLRRSLVLFVVAFLVATSFVPIGSGAVPDARLSITDASVTPDTPVTGAPITVDATVRLSGGSSSAVEVVRVYLRTPDGERRGTAENLGSLSPGETLSVPLTTTFETAGQRNLTIVAVVEDEDGDRTTAERPVTVTVEQAPPLIEVEFAEVVADVRTPLDVTVSNPTTTPIRNVVITAIGPDGQVESRRTLPSLAAGATEAVNLSVQPSATGDVTYTVGVAYTTSRGTRSSVNLTRTVRAAPLVDDLGVRVSRVSPDGGDGAGAAGGLQGVLGGNSGSALQSDEEDQEAENTVQVTVTNFGNAPLRNVVLEPRDDNGSRLSAVGRQYVAEVLSPGESETVTVDLERVTSVGRIQFVTLYQVGNESRSAQTAYDFRPARGAVEVTDLNVSFASDGRVQLEGNIGNVGDGELTGVVVSVVNGTGVRPAYPGRSYFVGSIEGSEFAPFQLLATVDPANATGLKIRVEYTAANERNTEMVVAPLPRPDAQGGRPLGAFGLGLLAIGFTVPAAIALLTRRYR